MAPPDKLAELIARLAEAEEALAALSGGNADAMILAQDVIRLPGSEQPYQAFFESMNEGGLTLDAEGRILHCNPRFSTMLGHPVDALRGQSFLDHVVERDFALVSNCIFRDEIGTCEAELSKLDHSSIPVLLSLRPMKLGGQRFKCLVVTDLSERVAAEARLRAQFAFNELLIDTAQVIILVLDTEGRIQRINTYLETISGYSAEEVLSRDWFETFLPERERARCRTVFQEATGGSQTHGYVNPILDRWGGERLVEWYDKTLKDESGAAIGLLSIGLDISEREQAMVNLRRAAIVFDNSQEGVIVCDGDNRIVDVNPAFHRITGYGRDEVLGQDPNLLKSGLHDETFFQRLWQSLHDTGAWRGEIWDRRKNGEVFTSLMSVNALRDDRTGKVEHYIAVFSDISLYKAHAEELNRVAHYDPLTSLPNRRLFGDRLEQSLGRARRGGKTLAVCYLDLDGFKQFNDQFGHEIGDRLLIEIGRRLQDGLRAGDTLARLSGDEFALLLNEFDADKEGFQALDRILGIVAMSSAIDGERGAITASLGVTLFPRDDADADTLMRHADQSMVRAKEAGKNRFHLFDPDYDIQVKVHREALRRLTQAYAQNEFVLHYQPKVSLLDGSVFGAEALIRWQHPERGLVPPLEFLPLLEGSELEFAIGEWVIETTLRQIAEWNAAGLPLVVSANISPAHLQHPDFVERLKASLARHPEVPGRQLELEILESAAIIDIEQARSTLLECLELGVHFALDDFGTGYSSLTYFRKLPVETLKIDQTFVRDMLDDPEDLGIVESVLRLARAFRRPVIAEGVETLEHAAMLVFLGCEYGQGYGISRPIPAHVFPQWLQTWNNNTEWQHIPDKIRTQNDVVLLAAENSHCKWLEQLVHHIEAEHGADVPVLSSHSCRFGRWYFGSGQSEYGQYAEFKAIDSVHGRVHHLAAELVALVDSGQRLQALARLPELQLARDAFLAALSRLTDKVHGIQR